MNMCFREIKTDFLNKTQVKLLDNFSKFIIYLLKIY